MARFFQFVFCGCNGQSKYHKKQKRYTKEMNSVEHLLNHQLKSLKPESMVE
ncbi:hypothetical protein [Fodinibius salinus]|uniref:hypothetical protein n=1 Tax=Fodinibius salinus TaxID=860790 RepID=UPI001478D1BB|nr:hypothetical protein [Fodinibius salinus]